MRSGSTLRHYPAVSKRLSDEARRVAASVVKRERRAGRLVKSPCEKCGSASSEAHHDDYGKPLEIRWLCRKHHAAWHAKNGRPPEASKAALLRRYEVHLSQHNIGRELIASVTSQIEAVMIESGISKSELSRLTGSSRQNINSQFVGGIRTLKTLATLADCLGCDVRVVIARKAA